MCVALDRHAPRGRRSSWRPGIPTTVIPRRWTLDPLADWQLVRHRSAVAAGCGAHVGLRCPACSVRACAGEVPAASSGQYRIEPLADGVGRGCIERRLAAHVQRDL